MTLEILEHSKRMFGKEFNSYIIKLLNLEKRGYIRKDALDAASALINSVYDIEESAVPYLTIRERSKLIAHRNHLLDEYMRSKHCGWPKIEFMELLERGR